MTVVEIAKLYIGRPYRWGGSNPLQGFDCSGLVIEVFKSLGVLGPSVDMTSQGLYLWAKNGGRVGERRPGALAFFGKSKSQITHVAILLDEKLMIEAGGGDSRTTTLAAAEKTGACVRIRPIRSRKDLVDVVLPNYSNLQTGG